MECINIMPCLDIKDGSVVKGIHFVDLKNAGDPVEQALFYEREGADELAFLDITATIEGRKTTADLVKRVAEAIKIPLTVGGGIGEIYDFERLFTAGAEKISVNTAAFRDPGLLKEAADAFGRERIVVAIDAKKTNSFPSGYELYINGGRTPAGKDAVEWARRAAELGAGSLLPTSIDTDGTKDGYDLILTKSIAEASGLPVIASGGAGTLEHLYLGATEGKATTLLAASIFHFRELSIYQVKHYLRERGLPVRMQFTETQGV
ncbi:MAG: imidazole glycerol phosphate synthase subunit HisF [Syntrophales bacterium]|nr:imidazole glycerol phosphate synthase subunit HisF [Syntrophales bacterium]MDY0043517.1 imidazole glycerol phosphate synthase subunit HisF [Syntrophales bacterium]